ncbi:sensor histidine kinase [Herbidospora cretacea]|uniref:sensor histidine kinase n=1 Tax=Herbidospora cretacea TaxID=28444 RepID=UPI000772FD45|nr:ATP-binding protein [Herbidospora cretacea]
MAGPEYARDDQPAAPVATDGWLLAVSEPGIGRLALQARERLNLLCDAGSHVGTSLDVTRTAEELAEIAVPRFADHVGVDLSDQVLRGMEPTTLDGGLRRVALSGVGEDPGLHPVGALIAMPPSTPQARSVAIEQPVLEPLSSLIAAPVRARGVTFGVVSFYRSRSRKPFEEDDLALAEELVNRAAVCVDNACRYTHERAIAAELEDVTRSLRHALDYQRRFTADASHELRTPLTGLRIQLEEAQLHPDETDLADLLSHALTDVDRLQAILTDLLSLARSGATPLTDLEPVDLADLVEAEISRRIGDPHPARLDLTPGVVADAVPIQVCRVLNNLVNNAQRHATRLVTVGVRRSGDMAELSVTDDGPGVCVTEREHIFKPFTRLDSARSRDRGGTGLGLAIARDIARAHHGTLHVEDAAPNGARFVLRLPVTPS